MKNRERKAVWFVAILALATAAAAQQTSIRLPVDNPVSEVKSGAGDEAVRRNCIVCHSTDYIVRQPHLDAPHWDAEVKKMINVFGARISDSDAKTIADYLAKNYGTDAAPEKKPESAKP